MSIPRQNSRWVDENGQPTREFYDWARRLSAPEAEASISLGSLSNVSIGIPIDGQTLAYNATADQWLNATPSGGGGYDEGSSFPGSPASGDKFYRTDLNWLCFYDGTRWLTCHEYSEPISIQDLLTPWATNNVSSGYLVPRRDYQPYLTRLTGSALVVTTNNGSNYWTVTLRYKNSSNVATTIATTNTSSFSPTTLADTSISINTPLSTSAFLIDVLLNTVGSPGAIYLFNTLNYRLIIT